MSRKLQLAVAGLGVVVGALWLANTLTNTESSVGEVIQMGWVGLDDPTTNAGVVRLISFEYKGETLEGEYVGHIPTEEDSIQGAQVGDSLAVFFDRRNPTETVSYDLFGVLGGPILFALLPFLVWLGVVLYQIIRQRPASQSPINTGR